MIRTLCPDATASKRPLLWNAREAIGLPASRVIKYSLYIQLSDTLDFRMMNLDFKRRITHLDAIALLPLCVAFIVHYSCISAMIC